MTADAAELMTENHVFEADVARLLHMMVHSVYSDKDVFLRELISNAADACEKLRYEALAAPELLGANAAGRITVSLDEAGPAMTVEDNGIGMSRDEMIEALGTIARSGTRAFMDRIEAHKGGESAQLIGQFGVGFYSCFMVADRVDVVSRRAGSAEAWAWSSDGKGTFAVMPADLEAAPERGTRITLHLMEDARKYISRTMVEKIITEQSGHVPVPIFLGEGADMSELTDGSALWTKPKSDITKDQHTDFYRSLSGQYDDPALTVHFRAEGRHEYTALAYVPGTQPFDMFDPDRKGRMKLYVKRVFITDDADLLPRYLRFVRGLVDTSDLPLNVSREMIQESAILSSIRKGLTNRIVTAIEKLAESEPETFRLLWDNFGAVLKEGIYEDFEKSAQLLALSRFRSTTSGEAKRSLAEYVKDAKEGQDAIYYIVGSNPDQLRSSPQIEGLRARGVEVLLLSDSIDSFWTMNAPEFEGKPFKSVTQGTADLSRFEKVAGEGEPSSPASEDVGDLLSFAKTTLAGQVSDVRGSDRLTESAVCLVAAETGYDRQLEKILQSAGQLDATAKPVLEINLGHAMIRAIADRIDDTELKTDAVHLLLDQARILDGDRPSDPRAFAERLQRVFQRASKN